MVLGGFHIDRRIAQAGGVASSAASFTINDALNIFAFDPHLNLGALVKALQSKSVLQILAEPNLIAYNGQEASFLAGGEFPIPIVSGIAGQVSIQITDPAGASDVAVIYVTFSGPEPCAVLAMRYPVEDEFSRWP